MPKLTITNLSSTETAEIFDAAGLSTLSISVAPSANKTVSLNAMDYARLYPVLQALVTSGAVSFTSVADLTVDPDGAGQLFRASITLTVAQSNAGKVILADTLVPAGRKVYLHNVQASVGGATAWSATASSTKLSITDTNGTPVAMCDLLLAGLTGSALLLPSDATNCALKVGAVTGGTAAKGLTIKSDGTHDVVAGSDITLQVWGAIA